jgi:GAF domain-containing protein
LTEYETSTNDDDVLAVATAFTEVARKLFLADNLEDTLVRTVDLCVVTIEACEFAGALLFENGAITARASTDPIVDELDALQLRFGESPGLEALSQKLPIYTNEVASDGRWRNFGPAAGALGVRSLLALPMTANGTIGTLSISARYPDAFGVIDRARGLLLASMAAFACSTARSHEDEERLTQNLHAALGTRELIGQAQGILIERERITADQAFHILRQASQHLNVKLREVAQDLVDTGERPDTGLPR